jgi:hypothetical protein
VFNNRVLRIIFEYKWEEVTEESGKLSCLFVICCPTGLSVAVHIKTFEELRQEAHAPPTRLIVRFDRL